jgi:uncharacterized membrane protein YhaH (DUF805 family)
MLTPPIGPAANSSSALSATLWRRIYERVGAYWKGLAVAVFFMAGAAATQPTLAVAMKPLLDEGFSGAKPEYVWQVPLAIIALISLRGVCNFFSDYLLAWVANNVLLGVRADMFEKLLSMPDSEFKKGDTGRLLNRFTVDAGNVTSYATDVLTVVVRESLVVIAAACGRQHVPVAFLAEDSRDLIGELREWITLDDSLSLAHDPSRSWPRSVFDSVAAQIVVATSGTSGPPKLVEHSWDSLLAAARLAEQWHSLAWLLVYDATRWAGLQVWLQALLTGGWQELPIEASHALAVRQLPPLHCDPFDRLLLAQAQVEGMLLLTADSQLSRYPGPVRYMAG